MFVIKDSEESKIEQLSVENQMVSFTYTFQNLLNIELCPEFSIILTIEIHYCLIFIYFPLFIEGKKEKLVIFYKLKFQRI